MRWLVAWLLVAGTWASAREPVRVTIHTEPLEARIYDQQAQYLGLTGQPVALDFTRYGTTVQLTLQKPGYQPAVQTLTAGQLESGRFPEQGAIPLIALKSPHSYVWVLWAAGGIGVAAGVVLAFRRRVEPVEAPPPVEHGRRVGPYVLGDELGRGGMGEVYRARKDGHEVALKILKPEAQELERQQREIAITARLNHKGIIRLLDSGEVEGGYYIVMELVPGKTLRDHLEETGALPPATAAPLLKQLCLALGYAHRQGVTHRDVKPDNVMVTKDGTVKVMDFGLARAESSPNLTKSGDTFGTPAYMAPEQIEGRSEPASDQYALGLIAFEMLAGRLPYTKTEPMEMLICHLHEPPPPPSMVNPRLPEAVDAVILRMLEKSPARRYPSLEAAWVALEGALS